MRPLIFLLCVGWLCEYERRVEAEWYTANYRAVMGKAFQHFAERRWYCRNLARGITASAGRNEFTGPVPVSTAWPEEKAK